MKRRMLAIILGMIMVSTLFLTACGDSGGGGSEEGSGEAEYKFTCASFYSTLSEQSKITENWIRDIEEASGGRIEITYYPDSSLIKEETTIESLQQGVVDIAMADAYFTPGLFPGLNLAARPWGWSNGYVANHVINDFIGEYELAEFSTNKVRPLFIHSVPPIILASNKKIESIDDFKGLVVRTGDEAAAEWVKSLGGIPYSCQITELYDAMAKGTCDACFTGKDALEVFNIAEVSKYVIEDENWAQLSIIFMMMNDEKFNSMPEDLQQVFIDVSAKYNEEFARYWAYSDATACDAFEALGDGREVYKLDSVTHDAVAAAFVAPNEAYMDNLALEDSDKAAYEKFIKERIAYWDSNTPSDDEIMSWYKEYFAAG